MLYVKPGLMLRTVMFCKYSTMVMSAAISVACREISGPELTAENSFRISYMEWNRFTKCLLHHKKQNRYKSRYLDACGNFGNLCHDLIGVSRPQMKRGSFVNDVAVPRQGTNRIPNVPNDRIFIWDAVPIRKKWSNENKKRKEPNKTRLIVWDGPREILCTL